MTCKVCGSEVSADATFCFDCADEWAASSEYGRWTAPILSRQAQDTALMDFITRVRLERMNGVKA